MKILVDVEELQEQGLITADLVKVLKDHAMRDTGSTAINFLLAFGAIAVAAGLVTLTQSAPIAAALGVAFVAMGWFARTRAEVWSKLGSVWMVVGALTTVGALGYLSGNPVGTAILAAIIFACVAVLAGSRLLIALVPLAIESALGGSTGYWSACYEIVVREPTMTIIVFAILGFAAWQVTKNLKGINAALSLTFTRMCIIIVNMGFWVGSLWGDSPGQLWRTTTDAAASEIISHPQIPDYAFVIAWALALLAAGAWAAKNGRRFLVNTVAVFGAIHLYTQWFERLGPNPLAVMAAGIATIAIGLGLWHYNRKVLSET